MTGKRQRSDGSETFSMAPLAKKREVVTQQSPSVNKAGEKGKGKGKDGKDKGKGKDGKGKYKGNKDQTVFVRGLPFSVEEAALRKDFEECGEIVSFRLPKNEEGISKGIAFIEYKTKEGFETAFEFDSTEYGSRTIGVSKASEVGGKGSSASTASAGPASAEPLLAKSEVEEPKPEKEIVSDDVLRRRVIKFLMRQGGRCTLKELVRKFKLSKKVGKHNITRIAEITNEVVAPLDAQSSVLVLSERHRIEHEEFLEERRKRHSTGDAALRENTVIAFVARLKFKRMTSQAAASEYLASKKKDGLRDIEIAEILRRFNMESGLIGRSFRLKLV